MFTFMILCLHHPLLGPRISLLKLVMRESLNARNVLRKTNIFYMSGHIKKIISVFVWRLVGSSSAYEYLMYLWTLSSWCNQVENPSHLFSGTTIKQREALVMWNNLNILHKLPAYAHVKLLEKV